VSPRYLAALALLAAGCGDGQRIAPVSGRVTLNGQPLAGAAVLFSPIAAEGEISPGAGSGGFTDQDGRYTLSLTVPGKQTAGAVVGKHKVRITPAPAEGRGRPRPLIPERYSGRETILEYEVPPGGTDRADFALKTP
jgi:hypothetical protein